MQALIRLNPRAEIRRHRINDRFDCLVVDDFLANPEEVVAYAEARHERFEMPERSYPGKVMDMPADMLGELRAYWKRPLSREFGFARAGILEHCLLSLTTLQPARFSWIQRLPHTDWRRDPGMDNYALLVYLFEDPALGGTGFYRYRDEAFWVSASKKQLDDPDGGLSLVQARYPSFREPAAYPTASTDAYELLFQVEARFNRMLCYSGDVPHSAFIPDASLLADDCRSGRLTLNSFAAVWPKS